MKNSNQNDIHVMVFESPEFSCIRTITDENGELWQRRVRGAGLYQDRQGHKRAHCEP